MHDGPGAAGPYALEPRDVDGPLGLGAVDFHESLGVAEHAVLGDVEPDEFRLLWSAETYGLADRPEHRVGRREREGVDRVIDPDTVSIALFTLPLCRRAARLPESVEVSRFVSIAHFGHRHKSRPAVLSIWRT